MHIDVLADPRFYTCNKFCFVATAFIYLSMTVLLARILKMKKLPGE